METNYDMGSLRYVLVNNIKQELKDFTQIQKDLKKSRKLEFRPRDRSLQSICNEIASNRYKISLLIFYYCWLKHGLKYWIKRDVHEFWNYQHFNPNGSYPDTHRIQGVWWNHNITFEEYVKKQFEKYIVNLIEKYQIELSNEQIDEFIDYLYKNIE